MDANAHLWQIGVGGVGALELNGERGGRARRVEGQKESVARGVYLPTAVLGSQSLHELLMTADQLARRAVTDPCLQPSGLDQVGEQECEKARPALSIC